MEEKEYQEKMTSKYGSAEELYKKIKPRYLSKEHLCISENNVIKIKENIPISYWSMTKEITKEIEVDGEIYSKVVEKSKSKKYFQFLKQNKKDYYEYKFDLLDLKYKFLWYYEHIPGHSCEALYLHPQSSNDYVNVAYHLGQWNCLDKRILDIRFGKFSDYSYVFFDVLKERIQKNKIDDIQIRIHMFRYGGHNGVKYYISLNTFFKIEYKKIKNYAFQYIDFFKKIGLNLKITNYEERVKWHKRYVAQIVQAKKDIEFMNNNEYKFIELNKLESQKINKQESQCYIIKDENTGLYKIGKSIDPLHREKTLQSEKPLLKAVKIFKEDHEAELHDLYKKQRVRGEWFNLTKLQLEYVCRKYN